MRPDPPGFLPGPAVLTSQPGVLETDEPSFKRIALPDPRMNDEAGFRSVVAVVAEHHRVTEYEIMAPLLAKIEKEVRARWVKRDRELKEAAARREPRAGGETPWD